MNEHESVYWLRAYSHALFVSYWQMLINKIFEDWLHIGNGYHYVYTKIVSIPHTKILYMMMMMMSQDWWLYGIILTVYSDDYI